MPEEVESMINELLNDARSGYQVRHEALHNLEEINRMLDDPLFVGNKEMAAGICRVLIKRLAGEGVMKEGSIAHRLGLRLLDYIGRIDDKGAKKLC